MLSFITALVGLNAAAHASTVARFHDAIPTRSARKPYRASRSKYTPHTGEREQQRRRMQAVDVIVLETTPSGNVKPRAMNAWLARNKEEAFPVAGLLEFRQNLEEAAGLAEYDKVAQPEDVAQ